jgi:DDE family transposase
VYARCSQLQAYARKDIPLLKLIVQHSPKLLAFLCGVQLRLTKPQLQHVLRLADALIVSEARHKTIAGLYRLIVDAPDPSNGADTLRISPWTAEDLRAPLRHFIVADLVAYAHQTDEWTLYVSLDDSLGEKDKDTRHLEAVAYHHDHTKSQSKKNPRYTNGTVHVEVRLQLGARSYAYDWRLYLREKTVRHLNRHRAPEQRLRFRKKTNLARDMLAGFQQLLPAGFQVYVLFDSWYAANRLLKFCRRQDWHVVCAIKSNRMLDDKKLSQWPQALRHQRYQRVQLTATDQRQRTSLVRTLRGKLNTLPFEVCVLISQRHHRDKHPKYFLCTDLALSAQQILPIYQKRWPIEVDNFYVKQHLGLADFRVQSYEATEKWFAVVFLALAFVQWRVNHALAEERLRSVADVVRQHRYEHARTLLEMACQEAAKLTDYLPVFKRFLCQPT